RARRRVSRRARSCGAVRRRIQPGRLSRRARNVGLVRDAATHAAGGHADAGCSRRSLANTASARRFRAACPRARRRNEMSARTKAAARSRHAIVIAVCVALVAAQAQPALAYLKFGVRVGGRSVTLKWAQTPVRYFVSDRGIAGVTAQDFQTAV